MNSKMINSTWRTGLITIAVLICATAGFQAFAQETASQLDASQAAEFVGEWELTMEFGTMTLTFSDVGGKLAGSLVSDQNPEPTSITDITKTDEGLKMVFDSSFGQLTIAGSVKSGKFTGTLSNEDGSLNIDLTGSHLDNEGETALTEEEQAASARRRRGPAISEVTFDDRSVKLQTGTLPSDGPDYAALGDVKDGAIVQLTRMSAIKLWTDVDMTFGDTVIEKENVTKDYPGVYSLWLKKVGSGWHLVFNNKPDVWGTQHDPTTDEAEIAVTHAKASEPTENLVATVTKDGAGGNVIIAWGEDTWTAAYTAN